MKPPPVGHSNNQCPSCKASLGPDDVLCIACGFHLQHGTHLATSVSEPNNLQSPESATSYTACNSCQTRILQKTHDRNGGLCAQCIKPVRTTWFQRKVQNRTHGVIAATTFFLGLGTGGVFTFGATRTLFAGTFLIVGNVGLILFARYGFRTAKANGKFLGVEPDMFLALLGIGYFAGLAVGALLPLYDYFFPLEK